MDTGADRKFSKGKFQLPSIVLEFTWLVIDGFMEENGLAPSPKKEIRTPQYRRSPRNLKYSQPLATRYEKKI